nr:vomeronasal type-1 receptor 45-like [Mirounga angustirostris]
MDSLLPLTIYLYILFIQPHQKKPLDGILIHLTLASISTAVFRERNILEDIGCKAVLYIFRVTWGACICTSSLPSTSQAIIISPAHSKWAWLKPRFFTHILPLLIYSWISSVLMNACVIISTPATHSSTEAGLVYCLMFCKTRRFTYHSVLFQSVMFMLDFFFLLFMIWASFHMVIVLFRHHKTPTHIHSPSLSPQSFPETKATHTILLPVSCFVFFCGTNLGLSIHMNSIYEKNLMLAIQH